MIFKKSTLSIAFVLLIITFFPWEVLSPGRFEDLASYRRNLEVGLRPDQEGFGSIISLIYGEMLFQKWLFFVFDRTQSIDYTIYLISLVTIGIFFVALKRLNIDYRISILLICPLMIDFFHSQLRNSLALSIFLLGYSCKKPLYKYLLFIVSVGFHLALILLIITNFVINFVQNKIKSRVFQIFILMTFSLFSSFGDKIFFFLIQDQRAFIYSGYSGMSAIYFIWAMVLFGSIFFMRLNNWHMNTHQDYAFIGSLLIVSAYFSGAYYGRYLAMFFPFILASIGKFNINKSIIVVMFIYCFYTFVMNFVI